MIISDKLKAQIAEKVHEYAFVDTKDVPFMQYVVEACEKNYCGMYGKTWQCPPGVGDPKTLKEKCLAFTTALVFTTRHALEDSFDIDGMNAGREVHEKITDEVLSLFGGEETRALSAEGCRLCKECTYPTAPCRFPDKARPSVESNGISVVDLAKICSIHYHNGANTVTYFSLIAFNEGDNLK